MVTKVTLYYKLAWAVKFNAGQKMRLTELQHQALNFKYQAFMQ